MKSYGGCWTSKKIIYINPYAINAYCYICKLDINDVTIEEFHRFMRFLIAHELAHGVWEYYSNKKFKDSILESAKSDKFNTEYLDWVRENNSTKLEEETFCEYMADSITTDNQLYLYNVVDNTYGDATKLLANYGLCSPYDIYKRDKQLFHRIVFKNYHERAEEFLNKANVTDEDVLEFLDKGRPPCTSKCIFFAFATVEELELSYANRIQFRIPFSVIEKYSIGDPIKFLGRIQTKMTFQELKDNLSKLTKQAIIGSKTANNTKLRYKYIVHCAIPMKPIPIGECELI
jgi:predicted SprT family Zn-dependent metalloprotease